MNVPRPARGYLPRVTQPDTHKILLSLFDGRQDRVHALSETEAATLYADLHAILMRRLDRLERALSQAADSFWVKPEAEG